MSPCVHLISVVLIPKTAFLFFCLEQQSMPSHYELRLISCPAPHIVPLISLCTIILPHKPEEPEDRKKALKLSRLEKHTCCDKLDSASREHLAHKSVAICHEGSRDNTLNTHTHTQLEACSQWPWLTIYVHSLRSNKLPQFCSSLELLFSS